MERVNQICKHPLWVESVKKIQALEQQRIFCRHNIPHCLDVARLSWIENLEQGLGISKELIYAAAMLHDIGRHLQYTEQIPHDKGSAMLAEEILKDCGFTQEEQEQILSAILQHRTKDTETKNSLAGLTGVKALLHALELLYRSDKKSRACLFCDAQKDCNWSSEKKNLILTV